MHFFYSQIMQKSELIKLFIVSKYFNASLILQFSILSTQCEVYHCMYKKYLSSEDRWQLNSLLSIQTLFNKKKIKIMQCNLLKIGYFTG